MGHFAVRMTIASLLAALTGCQSLPPVIQDARMVFDRPRVRRPAAKLSGQFLAPSAARAAAQGPDVPDPAIRGRVVGLDGGAEAPLEGALVSTSDGRAGLTRADGQFAIGGAWPTDGGLVATRSGYVASAITGLTAGGELTIHLRSQANQSEGAAPAAESPFPVSGRIVDANGVPQPRVLVVLQDAKGAFCAPVETGDDGQFVLTVFAQNRAVEAATILAASLGEPALLGAKSGVKASVEAGDVGEILVSEAEATVAVAVDATTMPGASVRTELVMRAPDGASLGLPARDGGYRLANLADVQYSLRVEAEDVGRGTTSVFQRDVVAADERVTAALLAPPGAELDPVLVLNEALEWAEVPGASGYQVTCAAISGAGFLWEGFTIAPQMPFSFQEDLPTGLYGLTLTAWDAPGREARAVANAGPRALRLPDEGGDGRRASRQFLVEL